MLRLRRTVVALSTLALLVPGSAIAQDLEQYEAEQAQLGEEIDALLVQLEDATAQQEELRAEIDELEQRRSDLSRELIRNRVQLNSNVRTRWMYGAPNEITTLFGGTGSLARRASVLAIIESRTAAAVEESRALRDSLASVDTILEDRAARLDAVTDDLAAQQETLEDRLNTVSSRVRDLRARRARQTEISRGAQRGTYACIFDRGVYRYTNSWGAPRSGGRRHKGTDVMAPRGARVYAFTTGRIERLSWNSLGGQSLYLRGNDGHRYYYAHLDGYADVWVGKRVEAGELVAYNGSTGNAQWSAPHVHFQVHPGGGAPVNPYHWLTPVCP